MVRAFAVRAVVTKDSLWVASRHPRRRPHALLKWMTNSPIGHNGMKAMLWCENERRSVLVVASPPIDGKAVLRAWHVAQLKTVAHMAARAASAL